MAEKKIAIDKAECENIERLHYEYNSYANVEKSFLDDHKLDPDGSAVTSPVYETYHGKCLAAFKAYEEAKASLVEKYNLMNKDWRLSFKACEVTIG